MTVQAFLGACEGVIVELGTWVPEISDSSMPSRESSGASMAVGWGTPGVPIYHRFVAFQFMDVKLKSNQVEALCSALRAVPNHSNSRVLQPIL
jgi:hypothetical protein